MKNVVLFSSSIYKLSRNVIVNGEVVKSRDNILNSKTDTNNEKLKLSILDTVNNGTTDLTTIQENGSLKIYGSHRKIKDLKNILKYHNINISKINFIENKN